MEWNHLKMQDKPDVERFARAAENLSTSLKTGTVLSQLLAIGECKFWTYWLAHYLSNTLSSERFDYSKDGIKHVKNQKPGPMYLTAQECETIGSMYTLESLANIAEKGRTFDK
ncbi:hypothetical protein RFI_20211, partial [Reticulomyxa filosa]